MEKILTKVSTGAALIAGARSEEILDPTDTVSATVENQEARKVMLSSTTQE